MTTTPVESQLSHLAAMGGPDIAPMDPETQEVAKDVAVPTVEEQKEKLQREPTWRFTFEPKTKAGEPHPFYAPGVFVSTVPTIRMRRQIGVRRAALNMGIPSEALDEETIDINIMLARFGVCLDVTQNPESHWSRDFEEVEDTDIIFQLYKEVDQHAATFRKRRETTG